MSDQADVKQPEMKQEDQHALVINYDQRPMVNAKTITVTMRLDHFAEMEFGTALVRGILDEIKQQILQVIAAKRAQKQQQQTKIIQPAGVLKVH